MSDFLNLFESGGKPLTFSKAECKVCGMFSLGGLTWLSSHRCPEPFSPESAQRIYDSVVGSRMIVSPTFKARLQMSWRHGYVKSHAQRTTDDMESEFR